MNKKYFYVLFAALLFCSGCGNAGKESFGTEEFYSADREYPAQPFWGRDDIKKTDGGYYFWDSSKLYFWDKETKQGTIVCSALNCDHSGPYCSGYFGAYGDEYQFGYDFLGLEVYNGNLYTLGYEYKDDAMDFYAYRISMDGGRRDRMCYLFTREKDNNGGFGWVYSWVMIDGCYYGVFMDEDRDYGLSKVRLDGETTLVYDMSEMESPHLWIKGVGSDVYMEASWSDRETGDRVRQLKRYRTKTGETETVLEEFGSTDYCFLGEDHLYYVDAENKCFVIDLRTGEESLFAEGFSDISKISSDGNYLYFDDSYMLFVYDEAGNRVDAFAYSGTVLFGDEDYLFIKGTTEPGSETEIKPQEGESVQRNMWIMDKKQLGGEDRQWMRFDLGTVLTGG